MVTVLGPLDGGRDTAAALCLVLDHLMVGGRQTPTGTLRLLVRGGVGLNDPAAGERPVVTTFAIG